MIAPLPLQQQNAAQALLRAADLPLDGLNDARTRLFGLSLKGELVGVIGYEMYPPYALLRSLVVDPAMRGRRYGDALLAFVLEYLAGERIEAVYGLTTTIPDWLTRLGFSELAREDMPVQLSTSAELRGACPDSARVFMKRL